MLNNIDEFLELNKQLETMMIKILHQFDDNNTIVHRLRIETNLHVVVEQLKKIVDDWIKYLEPINNHGLEKPISSEIGDILTMLENININKKLPKI